ncbi:MAG: hypothetical protein JJ863_25675 [Deltaproteobacteria bacterium]|nr:hypothetical protein [Deltaproteobacteria bacterium]
MRPSLAILLVLCACEEAPTPAAPSEPAPPTETATADYRPLPTLPARDCGI